MFKFLIPLFLMQNAAFSAPETALLEKKEEMLDHKKSFFYVSTGPMGMYASLYECRTLPPARTIIPNSQQVFHYWNTFGGWRSIKNAHGVDIRIGAYSVAPWSKYNLPNFLGDPKVQPSVRVAYLYYPNQKAGGLYLGAGLQNFDVVPLPCGSIGYQTEENHFVQLDSYAVLNPNAALSVGFAF